jgi:hypothetical protein
MRNARFWGILLVIIHILVQVPHALAHNKLHIDVSRWQNLYILVVINLLPIVAAILMWRRRKLGFLLLLLSMGGSFVFGVFYHFIAAGPDNVNSLGIHPWSNTFLWSAVSLALVEAAGALVGLTGVVARES